MRYSKGTRSWQAISTALNCPPALKGTALTGDDCCTYRLMVHVTVTERRQGNTEYRTDLWVLSAVCSEERKAQQGDINAHHRHQHHHSQRTPTSTTVPSAPSPPSSTRSTSSTSDTTTPRHHRYPIPRPKTTPTLRWTPSSIPAPSPTSATPTPTPTAPTPTTWRPAWLLL